MSESLSKQNICFYPTNIASVARNRFSKLNLNRFLTVEEIKVPFLGLVYSEGLITEGISAFETLVRVEIGRLFKN